jgi:hypothetical protein
MRVKAISCSLGLLLGQLLGQSAQKSKQIVSGTQRQESIVQWIYTNHISVKSIMALQTQA